MINYKSVKTSDPFTFFRWIKHSEIRSFVFQFAGLLGVSAISIYFLWLGFTPSVDVGQASLMLIGALLIGLGLFFACISMFASVWAYAFIGITTEHLPLDVRVKSMRSLVVRSIVAQVVGASLLYIFVFWARGEQDQDVKNLWLASVITACVFGVLLAVIQRIPKESKSDFALSVTMLVFSGFFGAFMTSALYGATPLDDKPHGLMVIGALFFVICISGLISVAPINKWLGQLAFVIVSTLYVLFVFNNPMLPFRIIAERLGIAETKPVDLVLSKVNCERFKVFLKNTALVCEGEKAGLLSNVYLLNSLGDRWVIRSKLKDKNIIFEGKDTFVIRQ